MPSPAAALTDRARTLIVAISLLIATGIASAATSAASSNSQHQPSITAITKGLL